MGQFSTPYRPSRILVAKILGVLLFVPGKIFGFYLKISSNKHFAISSILVQDGYRLGDLIMLSPAIFVLKNKYPSIKIDLLTSKIGCELLQNSQWFNECIALEPPWLSKQSTKETINFYRKTITLLKKRNYSMFIDFQGEPRGTLLGILAKIPVRYSHSDFGANFCCSRTITIPSTIIHQMDKALYLVSLMCNVPPSSQNQIPLWPLQKITENESHFTQTFDVVIHIGASNPKRKWPLENFIYLINNILSREPQKTICCIGGISDTTDLEKLHHSSTAPITTYTPNFAQLETLTTNASTIICHDSFMMHAGWALQKNTIVLFGQSNPKCFAPKNSQTIVVASNSLHHFPYTTWQKGASITTNTPATVLRALQWFETNR